MGNTYWYQEDALKRYVAPDTPSVHAVANASSTLQPTISGTWAMNLMVDPERLEENFKYAVFEQNGKCLTGSIIDRSGRQIDTIEGSIDGLTIKWKVYSRYRMFYYHDAQADSPEHICKSS